jgi:hypothetical protein
MWYGVDPLAEKYQSLSPFNYTANNPLKFTDPDGRKIVDANGNQIYSRKDGWSSGASNGAKFIASAMMISPEGKAAFFKMVDFKMPVELVYNTNDDKGKLGTLR